MLDCLVIGGGQSGLLCGHLLAQAGVNYRVVDSSERPGDVWRSRPSNLRLFTSRQFCQLADLRMPGDPTGYPSGEEFANYLERFAREKNIETSFKTRVIRLSRSTLGFTAVLEDGGTLECRTVINATGSNQLPIIPEFAQSLSSSVAQMTAGEFRDAQSIQAGSLIAVVGDGASGRQIAQELAAEHQVILCCGRTRKLVTNTILGKDVFWWLSKAKILSAPRHSWLAKIIKRRDPIPVAIANNQNLLSLGVKLKSRTIDADKETLSFADHTREQINIVIWCGGYRECTDWLDLPLIQNAESLVQSEGRTAEDGFFVVGRKWLTCRASELILGANNDTNRVVGYVLERLKNQYQFIRDDIK